MKNTNHGDREQRRGILAVTLLGILMRLGYVLYTPYTMGQHDTMDLGSGQGHLGYIEYFLQGGSLIFDFDPMTRYQFYHPPFFHLLSAGFVRINLLLGAEYEQAFENLQYLTLLISVLTLYLFLLIFKEIGLRGRGLLYAYLIMAFLPAFYLLSGSLNNDGLCLLFMAAAMLYALRWLHNPSGRNLLLIGSFVVCGALTKANALLVTPAIGGIFLYVLVKNRKNKKLKDRLLRQFALFAVIVVPLGLSWSVYNYLRFGMPFDFTPAALSTASGQSVADYSLRERLLGLREGPLKSLYLQVYTDYKDYNIWVALLKTAAIGEYKLLEQGWEYGLLLALTLVNGLTAALSVPAILRMTLYPGRQKPEKWFLTAIYGLLLCFFLRFCFQYPKVCSMDFRYITPTAAAGAAAYGWYLQEHAENAGTRGLKLLLLLWTLLSILAYAGLGLTERAW